ncbi:MAG: fluoride efflux transporter CrcB [Gammaproteobacteria bacterium]|nr:fluoride efflux transporter CrcB [Gammaproteobacteria bacterium]
MNFLTQAMIVGAGGFIGSALRFAVSSSVQRFAGTGLFPFGTLAVNVLGCLALGLLSGLAEHRQMLEPGQRLFLMAGVLGGFTTYSAFAFESVALMQDAAFFRAALNTLAQVILGFGAAFAGYALARIL